MGSGSPRARGDPGRPAEAFPGAGEQLLCHEFAKMFRASFGSGESGAKMADGGGRGGKGGKAAQLGEAGKREEQQLGGMGGGGGGGGLLGREQEGGGKRGWLTVVGLAGNEPDLADGGGRPPLCPRPPTVSRCLLPTLFLLLSSFLVLHFLLVPFPSD